MINFKRIESIALQQGASFPFLAANLSLCNKLVGYVLSNRATKKQIMSVAESALVEYAIIPEQCAGYRRFLAEYFNQLNKVDRYGKPTQVRRRVT